MSMKPLIIILLLFVFAYLQMGYLLHTLKLREEAKTEFKEKMKASLPDSAFTMFEWQAVKTKVNWEEEGKEFWLNGQLYDVVMQKTVNGKKYVYCLNDEKEEQIVEQQLKLTNNANSSGKNLKTVKFSLPDFILFADDGKAAAINKSGKHSFKNNRELFQYYEPSLPPPQS
jgi:hypothetical protein